MEGEPPAASVVMLLESPVDSATVAVAIAAASAVVVLLRVANLLLLVNVKPEGEGSLLVAGVVVVAVAAPEEFPGLLDFKSNGRSLMELIESLAAVPQVDSSPSLVSRLKLIGPRDEGADDDDGPLLQPITSL